MNLYEFNCLWAGNYTPELEQTYSMLHGDDRSKWPPTEDITPIVIDLDKVVRFNPHHSEGHTTVELHGGASHAIVIKYERFKDIMHQFYKVNSFTK